MNTKKIIKFGVPLLVITAALAAYAAIKGDPSSGFKYGAVNVLNSAATAIPGMGGANTVLIQNLGPNAIYCGDSSVATTTGIQVPALGGALSIDIVQLAGNNDTTIRPIIYCLAATADQASPNNTRYMRVR